MKKFFLITLIGLIVIINSYAQTITPSTSTEECPLVNITFTVTITGQSIASVAGKALNVTPLVVQQPQAATTSYNGNSITFSFVGQFMDNNNTQTFTVNYYDTSSQFQTYDFSFTKIKSLLNFDTAAQVSPNRLTITAQQCQSENFDISFTNKKFGNPWATPPNNYGAITNYEYQLPTGWKIGSTFTSSGTNWYSDGHSVTVTSDLSTNGNNGYIKIRPVNSCGASLTKGDNNIAYISISRPEPTLSITADDNTNYLCSGSKTYTVSGMSSTATIVWSITNSTVATIPPNSTSASVVVTMGASTGVAILTAAVTDCSLNTYNKSFTILVGAPQATAEAISNISNITDFGYGYFLVLPASGHYAYEGTLSIIDNGALATSYIWSNPTGYGQNIIWSDQGNGSLDVASKWNNGNMTLRCTISNGCGTAYKDYTFVTNSNLIPMAVNPVSVRVLTPHDDSLNNESGAAKYKFTVSPNPAATNITVVAKTTATKGFSNVEIIDITGKLKKLFKYAEKTSSANIDISFLPVGTYLVKVFDSNEWESHIILILR